MTGLVYRFLQSIDKWLWKGIRQNINILTCLTLLNHTHSSWYSTLACPGQDEGNTFLHVSVEANEGQCCSKNKHVLHIYTRDSSTNGFVFIHFNMIFLQSFVSSNVNAPHITGCNATMGFSFSAVKNWTCLQNSSKKQVALWRSKSCLNWRSLWGNSCFRLVGFCTTTFVDSSLIFWLWSDFFFFCFVSGQNSSTVPV